MREDGEEEKEMENKAKAGREEGCLYAYKISKIVTPQRDAGGKLISLEKPQWFRDKVCFCQDPVSCTAHTQMLHRKAPSHTV